MSRFQIFRRWMIHEFVLAAWLVVTVVGTASAADDAPHYYPSVQCLAIGIDSYSSPGVPELQRAESDAKTLGNCLASKFGYGVDFVLGREATKRQILDKIRGYESGLKKGSALIIYFAGHGHVFEAAMGDSMVPARVGYLIPFDAGLDLLDTSDPDRWAREAIGMRELLDEINDLDLHHVVLIADACCSGFLTKRGGLESPEVITLLREDSRMVLAATTQREKAVDGVFTPALVELLERASRNFDALSMTDLLVDVRTKVSGASGGAMTPQMSSVGRGDGEFFFLPLSIPGPSIEVVADAVRAGTLAGVELGAIRGPLERAQLRAGRRTRMADLIAAFEANDYRNSQAPEAAHRMWEARFKRFGESAALSDPLALAALYYCYQKGLGIDQNPSEALRIARLAYETGHEAGNHVLGECYARGTGVRINPIAAQHLFQQAAKKKLPLSVFRIALDKLQNDRAAATARSVLPDLAYAHSQGVASASDALGSLLTGFVPVEGFPTNVEQGLAAWRKAAESGHAGAQFHLWVFYRSGPTKYRDAEQAIEWLAKAAENGLTKAQYELALAYYQEAQLFQVDRSLSVPKDHRAAFQWASTAAEGGSGDAKYLLADMYLYGRGTGKNWDRGRQLLDEAVSEGSADAMWSKAAWIWQKRGLYPFDEEFALQLFRRAAELSPRYAFDYGRTFYRNDFYERFKWYRKSAAGGYQLAQDAILIRGFRLYIRRWEYWSRIRNLSNVDHEPFLASAKNPETWYELAKRCEAAPISFIWPNSIHGSESSIEELRSPAAFGRFALECHEIAAELGSERAKKVIGGDLGEWFFGRATEYEKNKMHPEAVWAFSQAGIRGHSSANKRLASYVADNGLELTEGELGRVNTAEYDWVGGGFYWGDGDGNWFPTWKEFQGAAVAQIRDQLATDLPQHELRMAAKRLEYFRSQTQAGGRLADAAAKESFSESDIRALIDQVQLKLGGK